jgi:transaldolase
MKFFIDTANIEQIREAASLGVLDGVTTNPSLMSKEKGEFRDILLQICSIVDGPVSAEIVSTEHEKMVPDAVELAGLHPNIVIKVPLIKDGVKTLKSLAEKGVKTNATLVFSSNQALLAAKAGATYVSPFIGRLDDAGHVGMDLVREIMTIYENYEFTSEVIVASVRNPLHVVDAALAGAHIVTMPFAVIERMIKHPMTAAGLDKFLDDWKKWTGGGD